MKKKHGNCVKDVDSGDPIIIIIIKKLDFIFFFPLRSNHACTNYELTIAKSHLQLIWQLRYAICSFFAVKKK